MAPVLHRAAIINYDVFTRELESACHVVCNFKCLTETEGLFKVTSNHVYSNSDNISETVQDRDAVTTDQ